MDVSIIIVNYNTKQLTLDCINSILNITNGLTFEIIIVDNNSSDGSLELFRNIHNLSLIENKSNLGFGRANNLGIEKATGKYIFLLNSDTILINNAIKDLFDFAESHSELNIGAIGTILLNEKYQVNSPFSTLPSPYTLIGILRRLRLTGNHHSQILTRIDKIGFAEVGFVCGANMFIPRSTINHVGSFDPDYFLYCEEADLQKRMNKYGYRRIVINNKGIIHLGGGSFGYRKESYERYELRQKGLLIYYKKHYNGISYMFSRINFILLILKDIFIVRMAFNKNEIFSALKLALRS